MSVLITQLEIVNQIELDEHFSVNNIKDARIQKCELLLANEFLGESFYAQLKTDRTDVGTFSTFQVFYDTYLKTLLSEYIVLSLVTQKVLGVSNKGIDEIGATNLKALYGYETKMQHEVETSKRLITSYAMAASRVLLYANFLGNNINSTTSKTTERKIVFGFNIS